MKELIEKWLSLFGSPWVFTFEDKKWAEKIAGLTSKYQSLDTLLDVNKEKPYGIHFSPNWNYGLLNRVWEDIVRKREDAEPWLACLFVDIDRRMSSFLNDSDNTNLKKAAIALIEELKLRVMYISETPWWLHLWIFFKESDRKRLWTIISDDDLKLLQLWLARRFNWWDTNVQWYSKMMRCPFTNHWKTWLPEQVKLYKTNAKHFYEDDWITETHIELDLTEVTKPEDITIQEDMLVSKEAIIHFLTKEKETLKVESEETSRSLEPSITTEWEEKLNELNITDVVKKVYDYPREYHWKVYRFSTDRNNIILEYDWIRHHTDWYKINPDDNYVINFSMSNHSKFERPTWWPYRFLRRYFNNNLIKLKDFAKKEFNIELAEGVGWMYGTYMATNWVYIFSSDWVIFESNVSKKWENARQTFIQRPIAIKWVIETKFQALWEEEQTRKQYIFFDTKKEVEYLVEFQPDIKKFNNCYWQYWLIITAQSNAVLLNMYVALDLAVEAWQIFKYDCRELNWYYDDMYVLWDKAFDTTGREMDMMDMWLILRTKKITTQPIQKGITVWEFWEKFAKLFSQRESLVSFTTFIALLLWSKFRDPILAWYKQQVLIPWLFLSGISRSWKTTALTILKNWFGLAYETKKLSIVSTTPQPLKQEATDDFILHLEEFTWDVWELKETIVRDILNKSKTARWEMDWSNLSYISRSQLILDWEVLPESESVINRCIMIPMFLQERTGNEQTLWDIMNYWYRQDFLSTLYMLDKNEAIEDFKESEAKLAKAWVKDRNLLLYSFLLTVNKWFNIYFENELIDAIMTNISQQTSTDRDSSMLSNLLADLIIKYRVRPTVGYAEFEDGHEDVDTRVVSMVFTSDFKKKFWTYFIWAQNEFGSYRVRGTPNSLKLVYNSNDKDPVNMKLLWIINDFQQYFNFTDNFIQI